VVIEIAAVASADVDGPTRRALAALWDRAFEGRFTPDDADHAFGGLHVLAREGGRIVGHASAVPRSIRFGVQPWRTVGYVEAVATDPTSQGTGIGRRTMTRLQAEIGLRWPVALLSTGRATAFYERLGWERWGGTSYTRTATGVVADGEHGGLMILRVDRSAVPDLTVDVTCEDRPGDAW
jgi:aminoglycoside 2'-N-acetyltransferase I